MHNKPARLCIWGNSRKVVCAKTEQDAEGETDGIVGKTRKRRGRGWRAGLRRGCVRVREVQPGTEEGKEGWRITYSVATVEAKASDLRYPRPLW